MTDTDTATRLIRLGDSGLRLTDPEEDVRGRRVVDRNEDEIGEVKELLVDEQERKVRFLHVASEGFRHLGATEFMIPVDAVSGVTSSAVHIDQSQEHLAGAPRHDPDLEDDRYWAELFEYWGYMPYWTEGYIYPPYPRYPGW